MGDVEESGASLSSPNMVSSPMSAGPSASAAVQPSPLPRWRAARDLQIMWYDLWRRRAYIAQGRHVATQGAWKEALAGVANISSKEMFDLAGLLGKNAGWKELLSSKDSSKRLKSVIQTLHYANANIVARALIGRHSVTYIVRTIVCLVLR